MKRLLADNTAYFIALCNEMRTGRTLTLCRLEKIMELLSESNSKVSVAKSRSFYHHNMFFIPSCLIFL